MELYRAIDSVSALADSFDLFLIDQFGVLHDGVQPYQGAIECLAKLKEHGKSVVLLSNSGKRAAANIARLGHLGFSSHLFDHVVTSGEVAWQGIVDNAFGRPFLPGNSMFLVGHDEYEYGYEQIGMRLVQDPATADFIMIAASRAPKMSLGQYESVLASAAALDVPALCCNPDRLMLTSEGLQPSAGEIAALYALRSNPEVMSNEPSLFTKQAFAQAINPAVSGSMSILPPAAATLLIRVSSLSPR